MENLVVESKNENNSNEIRNENSMLDNNNLNKTINNIFGQEYFNIESKLNEIKESSKSYFNNISLEYFNKCQQLINEFQNHFTKIKEKIENSFELKNQATGEETLDPKKIALIQSYSKTYLDSFNSILEMNEQILGNIKENINILLDFIDLTSKSLDKKNPTHPFLDKEFKNIINNWMFLNINFENYDFLKALNNNDIDDKLKDLLFIVCQNKSFYMDIDNESNISEDVYIKNLKRSNNQLCNLKLNDIPEIDNYFKNDLQYQNLKSFSIKNSSFSNKQFFKKFPNIEKLDINLCVNLDLKVLENLTLNNITELYLNKNGFINSDFNKIFSDYLIKNDSIKRNLQILSFKDNNLSKVDFNQMIFTSKQTFHSLKELDLQKNKIYKFSMNPEFFPSLKVINVCYNNFTSSCFNEYKDILVLLSGNVFLMDNVLCANYYSELEKKLNKTFPAIKNLSLSYAPKSFSQNYISNIKIGNSLLINLLHLDLSYNHMNCETFFSFIKNNKRCLNIKKLNLNGNELDDTFFEKFIENKYNELFEILEDLYINNNLIGGETDIVYRDEVPIQENAKSFEKLIYKLRLIYKFIDINKNLKTFSVTRNPFSKFCKIKEANEEEISKSIFKDENGKIIINCFYSLLLKIKKELNDNGEDNKREKITIIFDCRSNINQDLNDFNLEKNLIIFKNNI